MTKIIIGVDDSDRSADAVALGAQLARAAGAEIILANAYPFDTMPSRATTPQLDAHLRDRAMETLLRHFATLRGVRADLRALPGGSPARGLQALAEREGAALIVIGSSHRGGVGRVLAGTTAERLLHGAPCPVAVAPRGHAERGDGMGSIVVGYDGGEEATAALTAGLAAGRALHAVVRIVRVVDPSHANILSAMDPLSFAVPPAELHRELQAEFEAEVTARPDAVDAEVEFVIGDVVHELAASSRTAGLMIVGSRGYGPARAVLLGSVSGRLVREAGCPVLVIPRGADAHLDELFGVPAAGATA